MILQAARRFQLAILTPYAHLISFYKSCGPVQAAFMVGEPHIAASPFASAQKYSDGRCVMECMALTTVAI